VRLRIAAVLAERHGAHLVGCAATGVAAADYAMLAASPFGSLPVSDHAALHDDAQAALERFATAAQRAGVASFEKRLVTGHAAEVLVTQTLYADLVIVGQFLAGFRRVDLVGEIDMQVRRHVASAFAQLAAQRRGQPRPRAAQLIVKATQLRGARHIHGHLSLAALATPVALDAVRMEPLYGATVGRSAPVFDRSQKCADDSCMLPAIGIAGAREVMP
jgi:nucleotide-binding universal stress UspA family protein